MNHGFLIRAVSCLATLFLSACASYGVVENQSLEDWGKEHEYSIRSRVASAKNSDLALSLSFSGGGTRAAAFAYGVLEELHDTPISVDAVPKTLLDEVEGDRLHFEESGGGVGFRFTHALFQEVGIQTLPDNLVGPAAARILEAVEQEQADLPSVW